MAVSVLGNAMAMAVSGQAGVRCFIKRNSSLHTRCSYQSAAQLQTQEQRAKAPPTGDSRSRRNALLVLVSAVTAAATVSQLGLGQALAQQTGDAEEVEYTVAASGLGYCDTLVGSGAPIAKGTLIKAHYTGKLEDGTVFDSSYKRGKPLTFKLGVGEVIKGWDQGIMGGTDVPPMLPGGKRKLKIPSKLGYGDRGAGCRLGSCLIPPNSVLLFDVELIGKA